MSMSRNRKREQCCQDNLNVPCRTRNANFPMDGTNGGVLRPLPIAAAYAMKKLLDQATRMGKKLNSAFVHSWKETAKTAKMPTYVTSSRLDSLSIMPECQEDRGLVEELFTDGSSQDLVCTATLACVYLPADTLSAKESSLGATGNFLLNQQLPIRFQYVSVALLETPAYRAREGIRDSPALN
jgi:hypothetical protein